MSYDADRKGCTPPSLPLARLLCGRNLVPLILRRRLVSEQLESLSPVTVELIRQITVTTDLKKDGDVRELVE